MESPDVVNGLGTPQASSTKNNIFCHTPMLSENFVKNEDGKIVESLAEQLRAVLVCIDVGMDERRLREKRVSFFKIFMGYCNFIFFSLNLFMMKKLELFNEKNRK